MTPRTKLLTRTRVWNETARFAQIVLLTWKRRVIVAPLRPRLKSVQQARSLTRSSSSLSSCPKWCTRRRRRVQLFQHCLQLPARQLAAFLVLHSQGIADGPWYAGGFEMLSCTQIPCTNCEAKLEPLHAWSWMHLALGSCNIVCGSFAFNEVLQQQLPFLRFFAAFDSGNLCGATLARPCENQERLAKKDCFERHSWLEQESVFR